MPQLEVGEIAEGSIRVTKSRDGESGHSFGFKFEVVDLGTSAKGKTITTCVAVEAEAPVAEAKKKPLGSNERIVFDALTAALVDHGQEPPPRKDIPPHVKVVTTDKWQEYLMRYLPHPKPKEKDQAWERAMESLVGSKLVRCAKGFVWLPPR